MYICGCAGVLLVSGGFFHKSHLDARRTRARVDPSFCRGTGLRPLCHCAFATLFHPGWIRESFSPKTQPINMGALNATTDAYATPGRRDPGAAAWPPAGQQDRTPHFQHPKPVAGGLVVALVLLVLRSTLQIELQFDTSLQTALMLTFFASIGLSADLGSLKRGGKAVATFLLVVTGLLLVQNSLGVGLATPAGAGSHMGLLAGSITLRRPRHRGGLGVPSSPRNTAYNPPPSWRLPCATFGLVLGVSSAARWPAIW